jgi:hypothetical protein
MHCKSCDYPLWNLKARICPECGEPFRPSEFEFVPNSVQFCCPHCDQAYYGTAANGHLRPKSFTCVHCTQPVDMDEMVLRPTEGVTERQTMLRSNPWLDRKNRGWFRGWFGTIGMAMGMPIGLMRATPERSSQLEAWWFALLTLSVSVFCGVSFFVVFSVVVDGGMNGPDLLYALTSILVMLLSVVLGAALLIVIWGGVTHLMLVITGGCAHSIRRTYQAVCYSSGPMVTLAVPCLGLMLGFPFLWIWWVVSAILMVAEGQRVHGGRATLAVLVFPMIAVCVVVASYAVMAYAAFQSIPPGGFNTTWVSGAQQAELATVSTALQAYVSDHNGTWPAHAAELIDPDNPSALTSAQFVSAVTTTFEDQVPVGDATLGDLSTMGSLERRAALDAAAASLPSNVIAHRVGDFVFTYHGVDPDSAAGDLWIAIYSPDPGGNFPPNTYFVAHLDGTVSQIQSWMLPGSLQQQNASRAAEGLPALPPPEQVTHDSPATAD